MCMKNYNAEKIIFDKVTAFFNFAIFFTIAHIQQCFVKSTPPRAFSISFHYLANMVETY